MLEMSVDKVSLPGDCRPQLRRLFACEHAYDMQACRSPRAPCLAIGVTGVLGGGSPLSY